MSRSTKNPLLQRGGQGEGGCLAIRYRTTATRYDYVPFFSRISPFPVLRLRLRPPAPIVPRSFRGPNRPETIIGKSDSISPLTVLARTSVSSLPGRISVIPPFTVLNSRSSDQSARPICAYTEPFTVVASARPVVVTFTLPFTVLTCASLLSPSADISPLTVWPLNSIPAGTWTSK